MAKPRGSRAVALVVTLSVISGLAGIGLLMKEGSIASHWFCWNCWFGGHHHHAERSPAASLKTLATAEADFRANDRDNNGNADYWRADVAGLYTLTAAGADAGDTTNAIRLIEIGIAGADDRPVSDIAKYIRPAPKGGYWYRAIRKKGEPPVDADSQFAFCAFPDNPSAGRWTFIIDERNTMYRRDLGTARGIEVFPDDEELERLWSRMD